MTTQDMQPCCAHIRVDYVRINNPSGTCSDSWRCKDCGAKFWPESWSVTFTRPSDEKQPPAQKGLMPLNQIVDGQYDSLAAEKIKQPAQGQADKLTENQCTSPRISELQVENGHPSTKVRRYNPTKSVRGVACMDDSPDGNWVGYWDHEALTSRLSAAEEALKLATGAMLASRRAMQNDHSNKPRIGMEVECAMTDGALTSIETYFRAEGGAIK